MTKLRVLHCRDGVVILLKEMCKMPNPQTTQWIAVLRATGRTTGGGLMRTRASLKVRKRNVPSENKRSCEHTLSYLETPSGRVSIPYLSTTPFPCLLLLCHYTFAAFFKPLQNAGNHPLHFTLSQTGRTQSEKSPPWLNATLPDIGGAVRKVGLLFSHKL